MRVRLYETSTEPEHVRRWQLTVDRLLDTTARLLGEAVLLRESDDYDAYLVGDLLDRAHRANRHAARLLIRASEAEGDDETAALVRRIVEWTDAAHAVAGEVLFSSREGAS